VARQIAAHELRDRIVALLLKSHILATTVREVVEDEPEPQQVGTAPSGGRSGDPSRRRRRRS
jgi:hypothetical protein